MNKCAKHEIDITWAFNSQEYVPCHESVASKLSWQMEQMSYGQEYDMSR